MITATVLPSKAQTVEYVGANNGDWFQSLNWSPAGAPLPSTVSIAQIRNGKTVLLNGSGAGASTRVFVGYVSNGGLVVGTGGELTTTNLVIGFNGASGVVSVTGGGIINTPTLQIGIGSMTISGAGSRLNNTSSTFIYVGTWPGGPGTLTIENGGMLDSVGLVHIGVAPGNEGNVFLSSGGVLVAPKVEEGSGSGLLDFDGGILRANANQADFLSGFEAGDVTLGAGGGTIDSDGYNLGSSAIMDGSGRLTKIGAGVLTLSGGNTYTGGTAINGGTISISSDANLGAATAGLSFDGGTLQTTGTFSMARATALNAGGGTFDVATGTSLTQGGAITGAGDLTKTGAGTLTLSGATTYTGTTTVKAGTLVADTLSGGGDFHGGVVVGNSTSPGAARSATLRFTGNSFSNLRDLTVYSDGLVSINQNPASYYLVKFRSLSMTGGDLELNNNAFQLEGPLTTYASATSARILSTDFNTNLLLTSPTVFTVADGAAVYDLDIQAGIGGDAGWTKEGNGSMRLAGVYNAGFPLTLNGGTIALASDSALGDSVLTINGGALAADGGDRTIGNAMTLNSTLLITDSLDNLLRSLTLNGVLSGTGNVLKVGSSTFTLGGANAYTGGTFVYNGRLVAAATGALGNPGGTYAAMVDGAASTLQVDAGVTVSKPVALSNGGTLDNRGTVSSGSSAAVQGSSAGTVLNTGTISSTSGAGVNFDFGAVGAVTNTGGTISGQGGDGVSLKAGGSLKNESGGLIRVVDASSYYGVTLYQAGTVQNFTGSTITGNSVAVGMLGGGTLTNSGNSVIETVDVSSAGVQGLGSALTVNNLDTSRISGTSYGVYLRGGGTVTNEGTISATGGGGEGVRLTFVAATLINKGTINGNVTTDNLAHTATLFAGSKINGALNLGTSTSAALNLDGTGTQLYSNAVTGATSFRGALKKLGTGTWTLDQALTNVASTDVTAGTLKVNAALGGGATVRSGATLGGSGSVAGLVTVDNGGILSPGNSPGTLTVGSLDLNDSSIVNFELTTPGVIGGGVNDLIAVTGNLDLDGIFNLNFAPSPSTSVPSTYTLLTYGTLTGSTSNVIFGTGPVGFNLVLDTSVPNQVNLTTTYDGLQFWDGSNMTANNVVDGGSGTWNATNTNWTNQNGTLNGPWANLTAVFMGTAGTVSVASDVQVSAVQFGTTGYNLTNGGGSIGITNANTSFLTDTGVAATIGARITGTGGLAKTGAGTLTLSGANDYTGGTSLLNGTLRIGNNSALGTGALTISGGTTLATNGSPRTITNNLVVNGDFSIFPDGTILNVSAFQLNGSVDLTGGTRTITNTSNFNLFQFGVVSLGGVISNGGLTFATVAGNPASFFRLDGAASNTYLGDTTVKTGVSLQLSKTGGATALAGDLFIENDGVAIVALSEQIADTSRVTANGVGRLQVGLTTDVTETIGSLFGNGQVTLSNNTVGSTLGVQTGDFSGVISGTNGKLVKTGAGTLVLSGANTFSGGTTITAGTLETSNAAALGTGAVSLGSTGSLALTAGTNLGIQSLTWSDGGTFQFDLNSGSQVTVATTVAQSGTGIFSFTPGSFSANTTYDLITFDTAGSVLTDWTANLIGGLAGTFLIRDNLDGTSTLTVIYAGASTGTVINNDAPDFTPVNADFMVSGAVNSVAGGQMVNSLTFDNGSHLSIADVLQVTSGDLTALPGSSTITGGTLFTPGDLTKLGSGLLTVLSNIITGGNTYINEGALAVNGVLNTHDLFVQLAGTLKGSGLINGNVYNAGTVAPGNSPGTLTVNGNFTQASNGTLQIEVASPQVFDRLIVTGRATLAGTLQGIAYSGYKFKLGQQIPFLQAGSISGKFDNIVMPKHYRGRFLVNGGTGSLLVAPSSYTQVAQNQNQRNVAHALNSFIGKHGDRDKVSLALDLQTKGEYGNAFDQISPAFFQTLTDTVIEQTNAQNQFLAQRISSARLGATGFTVSGLDQAALSVDRDGKDVMDAKSGKDIISQGTATKWGVWIQGNGIFAKVTNVSQVPNYRFNSGGFMVGADYTFGGDKVSVNSKGDGKKAVISSTTQGSTLVLGIYGGYQGTYSKFNGGAETNINSALFGGYASYSNGGFYSDAIVGGSYNGYQVSRTINFSNLDRTGQSNPYGGTVTAYLDAGYDFHAGNFTFGPLLSGQYTYAGTAPFTENGADSLDLKVEQQNANSLRTNVGGQVAYTWNVTSSITLIPSARIFWQHEYLDGPRTIGASLDGGSGPGFDFETSDPSRDSVFAGVGVSANFGDRWSTSLYYNADFGRQDFVSHMISSSLTWKF